MTIDSIVQIRVYNNYQPDTTSNPNPNLLLNSTQ